MACTITIDESTLIAFIDAGGEVVRIEVEGSTTGCDEVEVSLHDDSAGIDVGSLVVTPDPAGDWAASFVHGEGFDLKGVLCGDKVTVVATCTKSQDDEPCEAKVEKELPCKAGEGGGCPDVSVTLRPGECNPANTARSVSFDVAVGGGAQIQYVWNFGDGAPLTSLATGSGNFSATHSYAAGATYYANLFIAAPAGCTATPDPITVVVDACATPTECPDDPRFVAERHLPGNQRDRVDIEAQCVPAGDYTISLSNVYPPGTDLYWSVDDVLTGQGESIEVTIAEGQTVEIEVIATKSGCPPVSESVDLSGCRECPTENELALERRLPGGQREPVPVGDGCIPAGNYVVRLVEPDGDVAIDWFEDGVLVEDEHDRTLRVRVAEGQVLVVSARVEIPGCDDLNPSIRIEACDCPDDLALTVLDADGDVVDPAQCVAPGTYTVRATASGIDDEATERAWSVNGVAVPGNGTEQPLRVTAPVTGNCVGGVPATSASITVATPGCRPRTATVSLQPCAEFAFNLCCQIFGTLVLLLFGLTAIAAALALCPQVLVAPPLVAFFVAFGLPIFLALFALLVVAVIVWFVICPPDWCRDILPKLWQAAFIAGITFVYFGSCPLCSVTPIGALLFWGILLLLVGAALLLSWILGCRPSQCETAWRLIELGLVNTIIGGIESVLGLLPAAFGLATCVSPLALVFLWLVTAFLDGLVLFLPLFCGFNPVAPAAFGGLRFRRPGPPASRLRPTVAQQSLAAGDGEPDAPPRRFAAASAKARKRARDCNCGGG